MGMLLPRKFHVSKSLKKNAKNGLRIKENLKTKKINYILKLINKNKLRKKMLVIKTKTSFKIIYNDYLFIIIVFHSFKIFTTIY